MLDRLQAVDGRVFLPQIGRCVADEVNRQGRGGRGGGLQEYITLQGEGEIGRAHV